MYSETKRVCSSSGVVIIARELTVPEPLHGCKIRKSMLDKYIVHCVNFIKLHSKKKLVNLVALVAKVFVLGSAQLPVLKGVAESLMVYYMRE